MGTQQNNTMQERYLSDNLMQHNATDVVPIYIYPFSSAKFVLFSGSKRYIF